MKNSKKLLAAVAALVVALAVSVGSTFAWFTTNDKVTVTGIQATVTTGSANLEVRLVDKDGAAYTYQIDEKNTWTSTWGYSLTLPEGLFDALELTALTDKGTSFDPAKALAAKGTETEDDDDDLEFETTNGANLMNRQGATATASKDYIEFYLQFRTTVGAEASDDDDTAGTVDLVLTEGSKVVTTDRGTEGKIIAWDSYQAGTYGTAISKGDPIDAKASDAVRVAFIPVTNWTDEEDGPIEGDSFGVWAPNEATYAGTNTATTQVAEDRGQGFWRANNGNCLAKAYELQQLATYGTGIADEIEIAYTDPGYTGIQEDEDTVVTLDAGDEYYTGMVKVRIWIEGTDGDCFNNIFGDTISATLIFTLAEED